MNDLESNCADLTEKLLEVQRASNDAEVSKTIHLRRTFLSAVGALFHSHIGTLYS